MFYYIQTRKIMKKTLLVSLLPIVLLAWCGSEEKDIQLSDTKFDIDICNQYFELADCILENDPDEKVSEEDRIQIKEEFIQYQETLKEMEPEELTELCESNYNTLTSDSEALEKIGCNID